MNTLRNKTVFISGATRGIGREIALRCGRDGANVVITGKSNLPHPKLPGTIHSVAAEIVAAGGQALAIQLDVRDDAAITTAVTQAVAHFGGIDILINNASAISLTPTLETSAKRLDLMWDVNMRATFLCSQACIPHLKKSNNPHILTLSPPLNLVAHWLAPHLAYSMSKFGMSLCTLGMAREFASDGIAINSLWPRTTIATAAIEYNFPEEILRASRHPAIVADAAYFILTSDSRQGSRQFLIDEEVLIQHGMTNFDHYAVTPGVALMNDLFLESKK